MAAEESSRTDIIYIFKMGGNPGMWAENMERRNSVSVDT
jgi:hypothetical protein